MFYSYRSCSRLFTFLVAVFFLFYNSSINSQVAQEWLVRYDGNPGMDDFATCMAMDNSNNIYIGGSLVTTSTINDLVILKYNPEGQLLWSRTFNGMFSHRDEAVKIAFCPSTSSIVITGFTEYQNNCYDIVTLKYSLQGMLMWTQIYHYESSQSNKPKALKVDSSGNIYITGFTAGDDSDFLTIKYDRNGTLLWTDTYAGIFNNSIDEAHDIFVSNTGNVYVTGSSSGNPQILVSSDFATIKYSSNGTKKWITRYNGTENKNDEPASLVADMHENVYVAGKSQIDSLNSNYEYIVIKYSNVEGAVQWTDHYKGYSGSEAMALTIDNQNNIYVTGNTLTQTQSTDFLTIKYNEAGERVWMSFFNNIYNNWDIPEAIEVDYYHNVYITGRGGGSSPLFADYNTVKYNSSGVQQWTMNYNAVRNDCPADIKVDSYNNVYVTGWSTLNQQDILTIKYSQLTGIEPVSTENPDQYMLYNNFPNPFNPSTVIQYDMHKSGSVKLVIFDMLGCEVEMLVNEFQSAGTYYISFNGANLSSGIYFYRLDAGGFVDTKKMLLAK